MHKLMCLCLCLSVLVSC